MNEQGPDRFYIVVRADLPPGPQLAQASHAMAQFWAEWPDIALPWFRESNYLVVVTVPDEDELKQMADWANEQNIRYSIVEEPDMGDEWTAVALQPGEMARMLCSCLPLALKYAEEPKVEEDIMM